MSRQVSVKAYFSLVMAILAASVAPIFIRYAQVEAPSLVIAALRLAIAALILAPVALRRGASEIKQLSAKQKMLATLAGLFMGLHFAAWTSSLEYTNVASAVFLVNTLPLWVALLSPLVLRESLSRMALVGMGVALTGGVIVGASDTCNWQVGGLVCPNLITFTSGGALWGDFLALAGALLNAGYLMVGRGIRGSVSLVSYIFWVYSTGALALLGLVWVTGQSVSGYSPITYLWILLIALIPQLLSHSIYNWLLRYISAGYISIAMMGVPVSATLLAFLFLGEVPSVAKLAGAGMILAGIYIATQREMRGANG